MLLVVAAKEARLFIKPKSPLTFSTTTMCVHCAFSAFVSTWDSNTDLIIDYNHRSSCQRTTCTVYTKAGIRSDAAVAKARVGA